uniref:Uncharacterized protein n=1 Tax=Fagus sylvatica TaxID=28930 RepID=A0A2N9EC39_FAGSY
MRERAEKQNPAIAALCHCCRSLPSPSHLGLGLRRSLLRGSWPGHSLVEWWLLLGFGWWSGSPE